LLGAGASVEAGIPDSYKMTNEMIKKISEDPISSHRRIDKVLQFVVGGLLFQQGIKGENPFDGVNIEDLFNAVILLGDRQNSELGPFISSWHPQLIGLESGKMSSFTSRNLLKTIYGPIEKYYKENTDEMMKQFARIIKDGRSSSYSNRKEIETFFASSRFESTFSEAVRQVVTGSEGELFKASASTIY
jgi:hypothetical protein